MLGISGVGAVRVFPTPGGQCGRVQCVVTDPDKRPVSALLLEQVQKLLDPAPAGQGYGLAPIGHQVSVSTVSETVVNVAARVTLQPGATLASILESAECVVAAYLKEISFVDSTVRISRIEAALVQLPGVSDITETAINGKSANLLLPALWNDFQVPKLGAVTLTEVV